MSAACRAQSETELLGAARRVRSHADSETTLAGFVSADLRLLRSGIGAAESASNGAFGAAETDFNGSSPCLRGHAGALDCDDGLSDLHGPDFPADGGMSALQAHHSSACVGS